MPSSMWPVCHALALRWITHLWSFRCPLFFLRIRAAPSYLCYIWYVLIPPLLFLTCNSKKNPQTKLCLVICYWCNKRTNKLGRRTIFAPWEQKINAFLNFTTFNPKNSSCECSYRSDYLCRRSTQKDYLRSFLHSPFSRSYIHFTG